MFQIFLSGFNHNTLLCIFNIKSVIIVKINIYNDINKLIAIENEKHLKMTQ